MLFVFGIIFKSLLNCHSPWPLVAPHANFELLIWHCAMSNLFSSPSPLSAPLLAVIVKQAICMLHSFAIVLLELNWFIIIPRNYSQLKNAHCFVIVQLKPASSLTLPLSPFLSHFLFLSLSVPLNLKHILIAARVRHLI